MPCLKPDALTASRLPPSFLRATLKHLREFPGATTPAAPVATPRARPPARQFSYPLSL